MDKVRVAVCCGITHSLICVLGLREKRDVILFHKTKLLLICVVASDIFKFEIKT